jgi:GTP-binding protein
MSTPTVAIVGRPNVGKSTLFNRIVGGRRAIVDDRSGVTRDRNFALANWGGLDFWLVDTGGWDATSDDALTKAIREQIEAAIAESDAIILVVDSQVGVHPADLEVAQLLRPHRKRVLLAANKVDELPENSSALVFYELGLGDPFAISASIGKASGDLLDLLISLLPAKAEDEVPEDVVQVAVVGRPNVGKSSILNRLLGKERSVVAPEAGTTRDAVDSPLRYHGRSLNFIDTAGLRKRSKVEDDIEFYSALRTRRAIDRADVCVLVVDATEGVNAQDLRIARMAWDAGTGLVVAVNKWDLIEEKDTTTAIHGQRFVEERVPFLKAAPFLYESAKTGLRVRKVLDLILEIADARGFRVATSEVNRVLGTLVDRAQPPQKPGAEVKLLYASQVGTKPPMFAIVSNRPNMIVESYRRYLQNGFRDAWGFKGTPLRLKFSRKRGR